MKRPLQKNIIGILCLSLAGLFLAGCEAIKESVPLTGSRPAMAQFQTNGNLQAISPTAMQMQVMRFADSYVQTVAEAADDFAVQSATPQARAAALKWKLSTANAAYANATGANPIINALDMLVLVTMSRMVLEDYGQETYGPAVLPVLEVQRRMETNIWELARPRLKPGQEQELRELIVAWRREYPNRRYVGAVRFREFTATKGGSQKIKPTSIFSLLYLDPFSGLDPTAAAIEETRQLGERAMYYTQRMPRLLSWQAELLAYQMAAQPESRQILSNANQLASATEVFASTAKQLPQVINDQRQAAIQQLLDGLKSQSEDVQQSLASGADAATAIDGAIQSLDKFVRYVAPPDTGTNTVPDTNSPPFNVLDYGIAASQIGVAARDLNSLLTTLNQSTPQLAKELDALSARTTADANAVIDHAFRRALVLVLVLVLGLALVGRFCWRPRAGESKCARQKDGENEAGRLEK